MNRPASRVDLLNVRRDWMAKLGTNRLHRDPIFTLIFGALHLPHRVLEIATITPKLSFHVPQDVDCAKSEFNTHSLCLVELASGTTNATAITEDSIFVK